MTEDLASYRSSRGLVSTADPEVDKPIYRKPGFDGKITTLGDMEELISAFLKKTREAQGLSRADIAPMLGLSIPVYGRYERAFSKMTVTRMIHLCEILGFMPIDMIFEAAPHLWGRTSEEAEDCRTLARILRSLPSDTTRDLIRLLQRMIPADNESERGV
ncbi:XRE family transcriptional regulator protein (plasmid) [Rhizobium etli bv. mimosae str. IE4771]|uniref:XRE family transcriptional regulator protein n=1 Tax=Rhizobium etli bv. mimosae str. IE4771 TaxID=1432050 RepID=A0A060I7N5_RHIET|nr:helix-turn-helix domain-containing protein [Rhizobium sp. IE4771]AIC29887.1 XRE family transcriptional regulator protein [Rhizobium sp. IE4771]